MIHLIQGFQIADVPLPSDPAIYILQFLIPGDVTIEVGRAGTIGLSKGGYLYVGSAKRGLFSRASRHLSVSNRRRWHIDHIIPHSSDRVIWWTPYYEGGECSTARSLADMHEGVPGIGSSDCRCPTHLFRIGESKGNTVRTS